MFQIKATVVDFLGDEDTYPCHFQHKIGDEFIYDGEKYVGRICPSASPMLVPMMIEMHAAGPRYVPSGSYYPFWYAPCSVKDPSLKKYDGLGFRNVLKTIVEPQYHMANLAAPNAFKWPPHDERTVARGTMVICPDIRTSALYRVEAFDISDKGYDVPYFRRQMAMLSKVLAKPGIAVAEIMNEFSKEESENIYPALSAIMIEALAEELELMGYLEIKDGKASVPAKGQKKLEDYKKSLSSEEREVLKL